VNEENEVGSEIKDKGRELSFPGFSLIAKMAIKNY
jgi:hypothetical protein